MDLRDEPHGQGCAIVLVTHDAEIAARADRMVRPKDGLIELAGGDCRPAGPESRGISEKKTRSDALTSTITIPRFGLRLES